MSKPRKLLHGSNIRLGQTPGGFTAGVGPGNSRTRRRKGVPTHSDVAEAARAFMARRDIVTLSTEFDCRSKAHTIALARPVIS